MIRSTPTRQRFICMVTLVAILLTSALAAASGRVVWKKTTIRESNEAWTVTLEFHMRRAPAIAHVPMRFKFTPTVYYERTLVDGKSEPVTRRVPLVNKQPLIETVDVGFLDPRSGKSQKRTRFSFKIRRDQGFEAGEYKVEVKNKRSNSKLGAAQRIILDGENEVIDRRAMVFAEKKKKKKEEPKGSRPKDEYDPTEDPENDAYWSSGAEGEAANDPTLPPPAHMQEKPGGCGCSVLGAPNPTTPLAFGLGLLGLVGLRRLSSPRRA